MVQLTYIHPFFKKSFFKCFTQVECVILGISMDIDPNKNFELASIYQGDTNSTFKHLIGAQVGTEGR